MQNATYRSACLRAAFTIFALVIAEPATVEAKDPLTIIVPLGAGGALDQFARTAERHLPDLIDRPVKVENFSGKKGQDGFKAFMDRAPDGNTVLAWFEPAAAAYGPGMSLDDLAIINVQEIEAPVLAARAHLGWNNLSDMLSAVRNNPGHYRLGIGGSTGGGILLTQALLRNLNLDVREAHFLSGGKARKGVISGEADFTAGSLTAIRKLGNDLRPLVVFSPRRQRAWPEVPTIREALGLDQNQAIQGAVYRFYAVHKAFAQRNAEAFADLVEAFRAMTQDNKAFKAMTTQRGIGGRWFGPKESTSLIRRSHQVYQDLMRQQQ